MAIIKEIQTSSPYYQQERELRNTVLLRPIGIPDFGWEMNDKISWHFVALQDDHVIGCVILCPLDKEKSRAQLMQMAVAGEHQGKGIGKMLVDFLMKFASKKGIKEVIIHSRSEVTSFYIQFGFSIAGEEFEEVGIKHHYLSVSLDN
ncbi:GNAT family N-acetyltransferase [Lutimonas zeaxanthinifaciens]|uniref:GNAT family N-acetyltransferase n=1 Tax=Lutimonas zeaxanthinifaciens TaxID=3060215 RepID=UPI00265CD5DC|nr:GNAT family N-acetyltransferase [Lutimonas sp. YSD2104]WKK65188.1 GNAT family N-acetyltransferase [Lutimonas sp. YSD2104]